MWALKNRKKETFLRLFGGAGSRTSLVYSSNKRKAKARIWVLGEVAPLVADGMRCVQSKKLEPFEPSASVPLFHSNFFRSQNFPRANAGLESLAKQHCYLRKCGRKGPEADTRQLPIFKLDT
jgi:hypothetical protein